MKWYKRRIHMYALGILSIGLSSCYSLSQSKDGDNQPSTISRAEISGNRIIYRNYATSGIDVESSGTVLNVTKVTDFNEPESTVTNMDLSPRGILFSKFDPTKQKFDVWFRSSQGMQRIVGDQYSNIRPRWSNDNNGEFVFFASNRIGNLKIWRVRSSGTGGLTPITNGNGSDSDFDISPKESKMVFSSYPGPGYAPQLWLANLDGSGLTMIGNGYQPTWSKDGGIIYYVENVGEIPQIWSMKKDATAKTQITNCTKGCLYPSFSPDGKKMVYVSRDSGNEDIWMMELNTGQTTQLTTNLSTDTEPMFSQDGRTIFFISSRGHQWNIWKMDLSS